MKKNKETNQETNQEIFNVAIVLQCMFIYLLAICIFIPFLNL